MATALVIKDAEGKEHKLRRLGHDDVFALSEILDEVVDQGTLKLGPRLRGVGFSRLEGVVTAAFMGATAARRPLANWIADVIGVAPGDFLDPDKFPLPIWLDVMEAVGKHPDVQAFFFRLAGKDNLERWLQTWRETISGLLSTSSNPDTEAPEGTG